VSIQSFPNSLAMPTGATNTTRAPQAPASTPVRSAARKRAVVTAVFPFIAMFVALGIHRFLPSQQTSLPTRLYPLLLEWLLGLTALLLLLSILWSQAAAWYRPRAPLFCAVMLALAGWDLVTLKLALMPLPYFPGPDLVLQNLVDNWRTLAQCTGYSLVLLVSGFVIGSLAGVTCGVLIGWSSKFRYWGMPLLKVLGPIPATALVPLALLLFPSAFVSGTSLIALAVWFPVTMLTASGIANVRVSYLDVARTLGAGRAYLIFRVAIPAAMPSIFIGLFMGLGASFLTLIVAETVGVRSGLGWYLAWAQQWADYGKVYAVIVIMALFFSSIMTLLFKLRDRALVWQKGVIKW
jgi:NitT/TauT family transport system permease protein